MPRRRAAAAGHGSLGPASPSALKQPRLGPLATPLRHLPQRLQKRPQPHPRVGLHYIYIYIYIYIYYLKAKEKREGGRGGQAGEQGDKHAGEASASMSKTLPLNL